MSATIAERVASGAALLDAQRPGWWQRINLYELEMSSCLRCVLGQEYGRFTAGQDELDLDDSEATACGFEVADESEISAEYASLESAWTNLIENRRATAERAS